MSTPRTVTVRTCDHGPVTMPEPAWCTGEHSEGGYRADVYHFGPESALNFRGLTLLRASLAAYPFAERQARGPLAAVEVEGGSYTSFTSPTELLALADALTARARELRGLAAVLAALLDTEAAEGGVSGE